MDRASYKKHRPYAGEKVPSMKRRCLDHDYCDRGMYMVTLAVEGRRRLLGDVMGVSNAAPDSAEAPRMIPSPLGLAVQACWEAIPHFHPEVKTVALQLMPDHLHGILFVTRRMAVQLGQVVLGFKQGCNKAYRATVKGVDDGSAAVIRQHTEGQRDRRHGFIFETGYNDRLLLRDGQLQNWKDYLADNPRRLLAKREHPDLFRVRKNIRVGDRSFTALGNRFLLERPEKRQVQLSRRLTPDEIERMKKEAEEFAESDKKVKETAEAINGAEAFCFQIEKSLADFGDKVTEDEKKEITDLMEPVKKAVAERNGDGLEALMKPLQEKWYALATKIYAQQAPPQDAQPNGEEKTDEQKTDTEAK